MKVQRPTCPAGPRTLLALVAALLLLPTSASAEERGLAPERNQRGSSVTSLLPGIGSPETRRDALRVLKELPSDARHSLESGGVVFLEKFIDAKVLNTQVVAVIPSKVSGVIDKIRDYNRLTDLYPEVRRVKFDLGAHQDTFKVEVKPHALLPLMSMTKQVEWNGTEDAAQVEVSLLGTDSNLVDDASASWRIFKLSDDSSLVFYSTRKSYTKMAFKKKLLTKVSAGCEVMLSDMQTHDAPELATEVASLLGLTAPVLAK